MGTTPDYSIVPSIGTGGGGGSGITQLTGDVLAGPGSGSVPSAVVAVHAPTGGAGVTFGDPSTGFNQNSVAHQVELYQNAALTWYWDPSGAVTGVGPMTIGGAIHSFSPIQSDYAFWYTPVSSGSISAGVLGQTYVNSADGNLYYVQPTGAGGKTYRLTPPGALPAITQAYYVAAQGSDVTGDGSQDNPFATISHALSVAPTNPGLQPNGLQTRVGIFVGPGSFQEPSLALKPWVDIIGSGFDVTYIRVLDGAGAVTADPAWATGSGRSGIYNCYLGRGTSVNIDLFTVGPNTGTPSAVITFDKVWVTGTFTYKGRTPSIDYIQGYDCLIFGTATIDTCSAAMISWQFESAANFTSVNGNSNSNAGGTIFQGALTVSAAAGKTQALQLTSCTSISTVALSGTTTLTADNISLPTAANLSITSPATVVRLTDVNGMAYTPAVPGNWSPAPAVLQDALDQLAARPSGGSTSTPQQVFSGPGNTHSVTTAENGTTFVLTGTSSAALNATLPSTASATAGYTWTFYNLSGTDGPASGGTLTITLPAGYVLQTAGAVYSTNFISIQKGGSVTIQNLKGTGDFMVLDSVGTFTGT